MCPPQVKLHQGNWSALRLREETIQWINKVRSEMREGVDILTWATKHLHQKGEEVVLRVTEDGPWKSMLVGSTSWPILTSLGDEVIRDGHRVEDQRTGTLLHHLWELGWTGQHVVENRPFHFTDIRTGLREYLQTVAPTAAFRYLGAQVSPHLNWKKHSEKIKTDLRKLTRQVVGAKTTWGPELLSVATVGKLMGTARFAFTFVPVQTGTVRQLDGRIAKALSSSYGFGYGISPWQVRQAPPMGVSMPSLTATQRQTYVQHAFSMLNSDLEEGQQTRLSLQEYGARRGIEGCPLAIPLHPLEVRRDGPQDEYWDLVRELMSQMDIAIDSKDSDSRTRPAPWQIAIPTRARGPISAPQQRELQASIRKLVKQGDKEGEVVLCLLQQHNKGTQWGFKADKIRNLLKHWVGVKKCSEIDWPRWSPRPIIRISNTAECVRDASQDTSETQDHFVSDGTVQTGGITGFAGCVSGGQAWFGRLNFPASSYEAEAAGLLESLERAANMHNTNIGTDIIPTSDCLGALFTIRKRIRNHLPASRRCLMTGVPLREMLDEIIRPIYESRHLIWTWIKAHTRTIDILPGTLTHIQDWCDRHAPLCKCLPERTSDHFIYDTRYALFDTKEGDLPGQRMRMLSDIPEAIKRKACGEWLPAEVLNRPETHPE